MIFRRCCIGGIFYGNESGDALKGLFIYFYVLAFLVAHFISGFSFGSSMCSLFIRQLYKFLPRVFFQTKLVNVLFSPSESPIENNEKDCALQIDFPVFIEKISSAAALSLSGSDKSQCFVIGDVHKWE